jgi:uncharacterized protein YjiS (DUF1127 family)
MSEKDHFSPPFSSFELHQQASIHRGLVMQAAIREIGRAAAKWLREVVVRSTRLTGDLAAERRRRSAVRELERLDDHMLKDIGVRRCEIEFAVRNGLPARRRPYQRPSNGAPAQRRAA